MSGCGKASPTFFCRLLPVTRWQAPTTLTICDSIRGRKQGLEEKGTKSCFFTWWLLSRKAKPSRCLESSLAKMDHRPIPCTSVSQTVVFRPAALASPGNWKTQILRAHPIATNQKSQSYRLRFWVITSDLVHAKVWKLLSQSLAKENQMLHQSLFIHWNQVHWGRN